jgi:aryl-alcohol dehydrogenase-like predicted oxidoreductase
MAPNLITLGDSGLQVSRIGLGLAALGRPGYINIGHSEDLAFDYVVEAMERRTHRMLDLAYRKGIRYIDAARSYGRGEEFLRSWLVENGVKDVVVGTKWGYTYTADWEVETDVHEVKDHSLDNLQRQWEKSKMLLPNLRVYQIHSATFESGVLEKTEVHRYLATLREEHGIFIGISVSGAQQAEVLARAIDLEVKGRRLFDMVQATFNIQEQSAAGVLEEAAARGIGVLVKETLANGRLTPRNEEPDFQINKQRLQIIAREYEVGMDAVALAFVLQQPWAQVVLSGAAVPNHLQSNMQALNIELGPDAYRQIAAMKLDADTYWAKRQALKWN